MTLDHEATTRRIYERINARDLEGFGRHLADDVVEHEELPGLAPTKDGILAFFRMQLAAFPDMRMDVEDLVASGDKVVARSGTRGPTAVTSWARLQPASASRRS